MIEDVEIEGRAAIAQYLNKDGTPAKKDDYEMVRLVFEDGEVRYGMATSVKKEAEGHPFQGNQYVDVAGKQVRVDPVMGHPLVHLKVPAFDRKFSESKDFYIGPNGDGQIKDRYERFGRYINGGQEPFDDKTSFTVKPHDNMEAPYVGVDANGEVGFSNGRHRYAWLRDQGVESIPVSMDAESESNARKHGLLVTKAVSNLSKADPIRLFVPFKDDSNSMAQMISNLHTSRLSGWGFVAESEMRGHKTYKLSAQLDNRTSRFCRLVHGKVFTIDSAKRILDSAVYVDDPNDLKTIHPWPDQSTPSMEAYERMTPQQLQDKGLGTPPFHPGCYVEGTQVYTSRGFIDFKDVDIAVDKFLSLNPNTHQLEWVSAVKNIAYVHKGDVFKFYNKRGDASLEVTPDHQMFWGRRVDHGKAGRSTELMFGGIPGFLSNKVENRLYTSSKHKGESPQSIMFAGSERDTPSLLKFLGYYLSEGSVQPHVNGTYYPVISQTKHANKMFMDVLRLCPKARKHESKYGHKIVVSDTYIGAVCLQYGKSHQKFVPQFIKNLSPELIDVFLAAYALGDGHVRETGSKFLGYKSTERVFFTSSIRMRDDLCELLIRLGHTPSIRLGSAKGTYTQHGNGLYACNHDNWVVGDGTTVFKKCNQLQVREYDGVVYDVTLEKNHTLLINHNGRISWGSNCRTLMVRLDHVGRLEKPKPSATPTALVPSVNTVPQTPPPPSIRPVEVTVNPATGLTQVNPVEAPKPKPVNQVLPDFTATKTTFTDLGIGVTPRQLSLWNSYIGVDPVTLLSSLTGAKITSLLGAATGMIRVTRGNNIAFAWGESKEKGFLFRTGTGGMELHPELVATMLTTGEWETLKKLHPSMGAAYATAKVQAGNAVELSMAGFVPEAGDWAKVQADLLTGMVSIPKGRLTAAQEAAIMAVTLSVNPSSIKQLGSIGLSKNTLDLLLNGVRYEGIYYFDETGLS